MEVSRMAPVMRVLEGGVQPAGEARRRSAIESTYEHFRLDRQGNLASRATLDHYDFMVGPFLQWLASERPDVRRFEDLDVSVAQYQYDQKSNLGTINYPNGVVASYTYDTADRLMGISDVKGASSILNLSYGRDSASQLTAENSQSHGYDNITRLTTSAGTTYGYDRGDNLTQISAPNGNVTTQVYDAANQLQSATTMNGATQVSRFTFGYDANGNRTTKTDQDNLTTTLGYDQANRLTSYGTGASYAYNGDGLRVSKTVNATLQAHVWDLAGGLPLMIQDGSTSYVTGSEGLPLEQMNIDGSVNYLHQDQLGSTRAITDASGALVQSYAYDASGNQTASTGTVANPFQYAGQYLDSGSGLYYLRARYYDPATGQFTSTDPIVAQTRQAYAYVADSPLNGSDTSGLDFWSGLQGGMIWIGQQLPPSARASYVSGVAALGSRIGEDNADLNSGDPTRWVQPVGDAVTVAATVTGIWGGVRLIGTCAARALATQAAGAASRAEARNLAEKLALDEAKAGAGKRIMQGRINDPAYPEDTFAKMSHIHEHPGGWQTEIHYWEDLTSGVRSGFKFKD